MTVNKPITEVGPTEDYQMLLKLCHDDTQIITDMLLLLY